MKDRNCGSQMLVLCPINKFTDMLEFLEYRVGGGSPDEGPLVGVVMSDVGVDLPHQFTDVAERTAANRLLGDKREPALDLVEPARVGGREVKVKARMAGEPPFDLGMLMSRIVVGDQVQFKVGRDVSIEMFQKAQELLMAMARLTLGDDPAVDYVERREERGGAVAIVIVRYPLDIAEPHRQHGLGALQGLHLALLVHAQYQRVVRRIKIKPNDVAHLLDQERVGGQPEALAPTRLQAEQVIWWKIVRHCRDGIRTTRMLSRTL